MLLTCLLLAGTGGAQAESAPESPTVAYPGDWYVLIHYRELGPDAPTGMQWDDQVWRFSLAGDRLRWAIFPHPDFRDTRGREERAPGGEQARSLGAWRPNAGQSAEIEEGLACSPRDEVVKRLRRATGGGWVSASRRPSASVSQVAYHELWQIEEGAEGPLFSRRAALGSGRTETLQAGTRFVTHSVAEGGSELAGEYLREGEREGNFQMIRMAGSSKSGAGR